MKTTLLSYLGIAAAFFIFAAASTCRAEDSSLSPYNKACGATKTGRLVVSPSSLEFYVNQEQLEDPKPIVVSLNGFALPNCEDANCTTEQINEIVCYAVDANGDRTHNDDNTTGIKCYEIPRTDDPAAHNVIWPETLDFCWLAAPTDQWIKLNGKEAGVIVEDTDGNQTFSVTIDVKKLVDGHFSGQPSVKEGWIQVTTTIHDPSIADGDNETWLDPLYNRRYVDENIKQHVTATLSDWIYTSDKPLGYPIPENQQMSTWWIPVKVYINSLRYATEEKVATTDWMDLTLNVPVMDNTHGALYILAEHPSLAPGQVFAYRWINDKPQFDLFSEWGHPVSGAENLYYAQDIQQTPIALPFSSDSDGSSVIPYRPSNVSMSANVTDIRAFVPVPFGGGIRLIGMEGDWIIRAIVGDPEDITNYNSWRELLYYVLHIRPITGRWLVTEEIGGDTFTYIDDETGTVYPLNLTEERGHLSGAWLTPNGETILAVNYANNGDQICKTFSISGHRVLVDSCVKPGTYEIYFSEPTLWGMFDYYYRIDDFDIETGGKIEGVWKYRAQGEDWSIPEKFTAVTQDVVVPLDPSCNCYRVAGKVNGIATPFIVDTGAAMVYLNAGTAGMYGLLDENGTISSDLCVNGTVIGVGGDVPGHYCPVDIEIEGNLKAKNVTAFIPDDQQTTISPLLGRTFLKNFHVTTSAADGTMIISK